MDWRVKALLQIILSKVPKGEKINFCLQRRFGGLRSPNISSRIQNAIEIANLINKYSKISSENQTIMEIGTGWLAVTPLVLATIGYKKIITIDIERYIQQSIVEEMIRQLEAVLPVVSEGLKVNLRNLAENYKNIMNKSMDKMASLDELLEQWCIAYYAPYDARKTSFKNNEIDIIYSSLVLEHISFKMIKELLMEFKRILSSTGLMVHVVDLSDHFSSFDNSITSFNYLKYSDLSWRFWGMNKLNYQNRLRAIDYYRAVDEAGFKIVHKKEFDKKKDLLQLGKKNLAQVYRNMSIEELAVNRIQIVCEHK